MKYSRETQKALKIDFSIWNRLYKYKSVWVIIFLICYRTYLSFHKNRYASLYMKRHKDRPFLIDYYFILLCVINCGHLKHHKLFISTFLTRNLDLKFLWHFFEMIISWMNHAKLSYQFRSDIVKRILANKIEP